MKAFLTLVAALLISVSASAQDLLVKRNGEQMRVKVLKITKKNVEFVRQGTQLPVYKLPVSEIDYIEYPLGDRDTFNKPQEVKSESANAQSAATATSGEGAKKWHGAVPSPFKKNRENVAPQIENVAKPKYSIGDIYEENGVKGIIAVLFEGGEHGLIMSLDEACLAWSTIHRKSLEITGANSRTDGMANMQAIENYITKNNLSWSYFPAFEWCRNKGEGWFLPSINELWSAGTMYLGGSRTALNRKLRKAYNENIEAAGGKPINNLMLYHSSTEEDAQYSYYSHMNSEPPYVNSGYKADDIFVRAFYKF
jgi:hypothetical protein